MRRNLILILIIFIVTNPIYGFDMKTYIYQNKNQKLDVFLKHFPYNEYLDTVPFTNFSKIQEDRFLVRNNKNDTEDEFLCNLADFFIKNYIKNHPIKSDKIGDFISIGEMYLNPNKVLKNPSQPNLDNNATAKSKADEIYQVIGYYILSEVAKKIKDNSKTKKINIDNPPYKTYIDRLEKKNIIVSREESTHSKIISNLKSGKIDYILNRGIAIFEGIFKTTSPNIKQNTTPPKYKQKKYKNLYPLKTGDHLVDIYILKNTSSDTIGHSIWLKRPQIKSSYYAFDPFKNYSDKKNKQSLVLATTGGYTTNEGKPDGFTIQDGNIRNAILLRDRNGLVLFEKSGGIRVFNIRDSIVIQGSTLKMESPYNSILSYSKLLNWCKKNNATVFQTHLLAHSNKILIDSSSKKYKKQVRERRLLALFSDKKGNVFHTIFNIYKNYDLAEITEEVFKIISLNSGEFKVEAIVNLDTGSYNILDVFDEQENIIYGVKGPVDIKKATNLIIYYK